MSKERRRPTLAPEDDLGAALGTDWLEAVMQSVRTRHDNPVVAPATAAQLRERLDTALPKAGANFDEAFGRLQHLADEHGRKNSHPGMFGYVCSPGLPTDVPAHALVAALNQNVTGFASAPGATTIERALLDWLTQLLGLPVGADGVLLSGGSLANYTALCCATRSALGAQWLEQGVRAAAKQPTIHVAGSAHFSIPRAALMLGLGRQCLRECAVDESRHIDPMRLDEALAHDQEEGHTPIAVVASAGTTTLGLIDPLDEIAEVCARRDVWFHVDGAYGASAMAAPSVRPRLRGIERADSVSIDLHKWLYIGFDGSALLLRDPDTAREAFFTPAEYVQIPRDPPPEQHAFFHLGPETSRRARALPAALALMHYGIDRLGRNIQFQVDLASYLAAHVIDHPELELCAPPELSVCCFRHVPAGLSDGEELDAHNVHIRERLCAEGDFFLSPTAIEGRQVLRVCILSPSTRAEHIEALIEAAVRLGGQANDNPSGTRRSDGAPAP